MDRAGNHLPQMSLGKTSSTSNVSALNGELENKDRLARRAAFSILSSFRKSDTSDPATYAAAITRVLAAYPDEIIQEIADPLRGIAGEQTFLPSIAELRASLDRRMAPILEEQAKRRRYADTEALLKAGPITSDNERARALEQWHRLRNEIRDKRSAEETRRDAEEHLAELYATRHQPLAVSSPELRRLLSHRYEGGT